MNEQKTVLSADDIANNYNTVWVQVQTAALHAGRTPDSVHVLAVSKTQPLTVLDTALQAGITRFGENYVQELREKIAHCQVSTLQQPEWHFIGHLQKNKVKYIARDVTLIHSVDSVDLAKEIDKQAQKHNRIIDILLQVNTSGEESKFGCAPNAVVGLAQEVLSLPNIRVRGLMTIAAFADDPEVTRPMFSLLRVLRDDLQRHFPSTEFRELSMGMTNDFTTAIQEGATYVRIGTAIFGQRNYSR